MLPIFTFRMLVLYYSNIFPLFIRRKFKRHATIFVIMIKISNVATFDSSSKPSCCTPTVFYSPLILLEVCDGKICGIKCAFRYSKQFDVV